MDLYQQAFDHRQPVLEGKLQSDHETIVASVSPPNTRNDTENDIFRLLNPVLAAHNLNGRTLRLVSRHSDPTARLPPDGVDLGSALANDEAVRLGIREDEVSN